MIESQVKSVRNLMLQILLNRTNNHITQYLVECIVATFILINKDNEVFSDRIDVEAMALAELPKYLAAGIEGGKIWARGLTIEQKIAYGEGYQDVLEAYDELAQIKIEIDAIQRSRRCT